MHLIYSIFILSCLPFTFLTAVGEIFYIVNLAVLYYPMFACVDSAIPLVGFLLGSAYSALWYTHSSLLVE